MHQRLRLLKPKRLQLPRKSVRIVSDESLDLCRGVLDNVIQVELMSTVYSKAPQSQPKEELDKRERLPRRTVPANEPKEVVGLHEALPRVAHDARRHEVVQVVPSVREQVVHVPRAGPVVSWEGPVARDRRAAVVALPPSFGEDPREFVVPELHDCFPEERGSSEDLHVAWDPRLRSSSSSII